MAGGDRQKARSRIPTGHLGLRLMSIWRRQAAPLRGVGGFCTYHSGNDTIAIDTHGIAWLRWWVGGGVQLKGISGVQV
jgi:hypothetical protein